MDGDADLEREAHRIREAGMPCVPPLVYLLWDPEEVDPPARSRPRKSQNFKSTLIPTTSPSSDLRSRIYTKVPRSTVQHELDRYIISVCGMFFSVPTVSRYVACGLAQHPVGPSFFHPTVFCSRQSGVMFRRPSIQRIFGI